MEGNLTADMKISTLETLYPSFSMFQKFFFYTGSQDN